MGEIGKSRPRKMLFAYVAATWRERSRAKLNVESPFGGWFESACWPTVKYQYFQ
jgi:hypothetical protein